MPNYPTIWRPSLRRPVVALLFACALVAVVCAAPGLSASAATASAASSQKITIIAVTSDNCGDVFWNVLCDGFNAAAKDLNVNVKLLTVPTDSNSNDVERNNILDAIAQKPSAIAISDISPSALDPVIAKVKAAKIPFVLYDANSPNPNIGSLGYIGNNDFAAGAASGREMNLLGAKHVLVLTSPPGQFSFIDQRVAGFKSGFKGTVTVVQTPFTDVLDAATLVSDYKAQLAKDRSLDGIFSPGGAWADGMIAGAAQAGRKLSLGTIDLTADDLAAIKDGKVGFATDQEPFSQGYLPVAMLVEYLRHGSLPPALVTTGPIVVTHANAFSPQIAQDAR